MIKNIQIVSTDIDGTMVNSNRELPEENIAAIKAVYEAGKKVVVNTGRVPADVTELFNQYDIKCAKICLNGGLVLDENDNVIVKEQISKENLATVIAILEKTDSFFIICLNKGFYTLPYFSKRGEYKKIIDEFEAVNPMYLKLCETRIEEKKHFEVQDFESILYDKTFEVYKLLMLSKSPELLDETKKALADKTDLLVTSSWIDNIEINAKSASKGLALEKYVERIGTNLDNVMAIGDSYNDVSMLEVAGVSVAMGNAADDIKELCDYVTESHDDGGWANAVSKFVL